MSAFSEFAAVQQGEQACCWRKHSLVRKHRAAVPRAALLALRGISLVAALALLGISGATPIFAQNTPQIVWEAPTPNGLANSIVGVGWAPGSSGQVAMGSTDRWLRTRQAGNGALIYSILGPQHSSGGDQTIYSTDGGFLAVHNLGRGLDYRVYRAADGVFLGTFLVTIDGHGLVQFAPDAQLQS